MALLRPVIGSASSSRSELTASLITTLVVLLRLSLSKANSCMARASLILGVHHSALQVTNVCRTSQLDIYGHRQSSNLNIPSWLLVGAVGWSTVQLIRSWTGSG